MKYIDAEKLLSEIRELRSESCISESDEYYEIAKSEIIDIITSLQQEQFNKGIGTLIACDIIEMTVKKAIDNPQDKEKEEELMTRKINYLRSLEENYVQQEQPEVDNQ